MLKIDDLVSPSPATMDLLAQEWRLDLTEFMQRGMIADQLQRQVNTLDQFDDDFPTAPPDPALLKELRGDLFRHAKLMLLLGAEHYLRFAEPPQTLQVLRLCKANLIKESWTCQEAVAEGTRIKVIGNAQFAKGDFVPAVATYLRGLAVLFPWSSDEMKMTFEQAGELGLRQIEQALILNALTACLKAAAQSRFTGHRNTMGVLSQSLACTLETHHFIDYHGMIKRFRLQSESIEKYPEVWVDSVRRAFERRKGQLEIWKKQDQTAWAHRECGAGHRCYWGI